MIHKTKALLTVGLATAALIALALVGCGDDDDHEHHHDCDPACTGDEVCQHGGLCGNPCNAATDPTVCETYDPDGEVLYCHDHEGLCEPAGEACSATDTTGCAAFQTCQLFIEGGTCASPCQQVGGDDFCQRLDGTWLCHGAAGGLCGPACSDAGGTLNCADLPGESLTCDATSGACVYQGP